MAEYDRGGSWSQRARTSSAASTSRSGAEASGWPFRPDSSKHQQECIFSGWLHKKKPNNVFNQWDRRFFRLENTKLSYYKENTPGARKVGFIPLKTVSHVQRAKFQKTPKPHHAPNGLQLATHDRIYALVADKAEDADEWVRVLLDRIERGRNSGWDDDDGEVIKGGEWVKL